MSATAQGRGLSHPAARAVHAVLAAAQVASRNGLDLNCEEIADLLRTVPEDVAALYQDNEAKAAELAEQREELCRMAQYIVRLEEANTKHLLTLADLKTRLARAGEENEAVYQLTHHDVGDATARHLASARIRDLLDLDTPLPPRKAAITTPTHYGAPRAAASH